MSSGHEDPFYERAVAVLNAHTSVFTSEEVKIAQVLIDNGQAHIVANWPAVGESDDGKRRLLAQAAVLHKAYPISRYVTNARTLLKQSSDNANPYLGFKAEPPKNAIHFETTTDAGKKAFRDLEDLGLSNIGDSAFVLVAGGLGERLGYNGIKIALPTEIVTGRCFLSLFCEFIAVYQAKARAQTGNDKLVIPLGIMTSDDTHARTVDLLTSNNYFGLNKDQVYIMKQEKVPALNDSFGRFALEDNDQFQIQTKPHGHGDVHMLLYNDEKAPAKTWLDMGKKWVFFFQDTNGLVFRSLLALLGYAVTKNLVMTTLAIPRHREDAIGAMCQLTREDPSSSDPNLPDQLTINVEYNLLQGLLGANEPTVKIDGEEFSVYPGNSNVFVLNLPEYYQVLARTHGVVSEFVNPKYKDKTKTEFKKPTRLECMMQDLPKLFSPSHEVGICQFELWTAFNPVKNAIADAVAKQKAGVAAECAASGEAAMYEWGRKMLLEAGAAFTNSSSSTLSSSSTSSPSTVSYKGVTVSSGPLVVLDPSFGVTQREVLKKLAGKISISSTSSLVLSGPAVIESLELDGHLRVDVDPSASATINLSVKNEGVRLVESDEKDEALAIRGYTVEPSASSDTWASSYRVPAGTGDVTLNASTVASFQQKVPSPYASASAKL